MTVTIALGIPHTPWVAARVESMSRLRERLGVGPRGIDSPPMPCASYREFTDRAKNHVWSLQMWNWAFDTGCEFFLTLQDDVEAMPVGFWPALRAMLAVLPPREVLSLSSVHPGALEISRQSHRWYRTRSQLVGWAYGMRRADLHSLLAFREEDLGPRAAKINEDDIVNHWILETGRSAWHPVPSIVDHDTTIASSYANDAHTLRRTVVRWEGYKPEVLAAPEFWRLQGPSPPPLLENARAAYPLPRTEAKHQVLVCTPLMGRPHEKYMASIWRLAQLQAQGVSVQQAWELWDVWQWTQDLVRVRSRFVRAFLETHCTHLWFVDGDIEFPPVVLLGMLKAGRDIACAPYPKRGEVHFERVDHRIEPVDAKAYAYSVRWNPEKGDGVIDPADGTTPFAGTGLGCCLIKRSALEKMVEHYGGKRSVAGSNGWANADLVFGDVVNGQRHRTVALFQLLNRDGELLPEDLSFFARARDIGLDVRLYLGQGSPVHHYGDFRYAGHIEAFGVTRVPESVPRDTAPTGRPEPLAEPEDGRTVRE